ncbi:unnamed protein product [Dicrocoelium dendriticum]|nr:unnamed protein product [Dicrocoelium dendriticum]
MSVCNTTQLIYYYWANSFFVMSDKPRIGTHNGTFHADEVLACAMLRILPEYTNASIVRTRDLSELSSCSIVVDVGGIFDPQTHRYDHHQRGFDLTFKSFYNAAKWDIKLSSAGLIYVHFGHRILANITNVGENDPLVSALFHKACRLYLLTLIVLQLYDSFIVECDAIDNGIPICDSGTRYPINTSLSCRVSRLNPQWNQKADETTCFMEALSMVEKEFNAAVHHYAESWYPAQNIVATAFQHRHRVDPSGHIMLLDRYCPWATHFHQLEKAEFERNSDKLRPFDISDPVSYLNRPIYCLYQRDDNSWAVQAISVSDLDHYINRVPFPEPWRGLRDEELSQAIGLTGCIFVHATGFLGIHKTHQGALQMAQMSLKEAKLL